MRSVQSTLFALLAASSSAHAEMALNLTPGVTPISHDIFELHMLIFWICVAIGVVVFGAMFYAMFHFRKSKGAKSANFHSHPVLEITWTIVPVIILVLMAIPATRVLLNMYDDSKEEVTIKVTGYQWKWQYEYMEDGVKFFSNLSTPVAQMRNEAPKTKGYLREVDHPIVVPIRKKIRLLITSNDVNHAWWVPDLGVKRDAVAGFINEAWMRIDKPGTYVGQCAELCGVNHAFMPIVVIATTEQGYKDWVAQQKGGGAAAEAEVNKIWTLKELMARGEQVYSRICAACHKPDGTGTPPTFPALMRSKIATGPMEGHMDIVVNGKSGTAMQAFKNQLGDTDIAAVITYERNAFGNNTGTLVQPAQIKALRDGKSMSEALATKPSGIAPTAAKTTAKIESSDKAAVTATTAVIATTAAAAVAKPLSPVDALKEAMVRGEKVYTSTCAVCHRPEGTGVPPTFPALKGGKIVTGPVAAHIHQVVFGKPGTAMQAFKDLLSDQEIADVVTYERNAWGNNDGKLVKPEDIKAARQQN